MSFPGLQKNFSRLSAFLPPSMRRQTRLQLTSQSFFHGQRRQRKSFLPALPQTKAGNDRDQTGDLKLATRTGS